MRHLLDTRPARSRGRSICRAGPSTRACDAVWIAWESFWRTSVERRACARALTGPAGARRGGGPGARLAGRASGIPGGLRATPPGAAATDGASPGRARRAGRPRGQRPRRGGGGLGPRQDRSREGGEATARVAAGGRPPAGGIRQRPLDRRRGRFQATAGSYEEASWSPHGLFVAVTRPGELLAVDPKGDVRWSLPTPAGPRAPRWSPDGFRIAYLSGSSVRVVAGDGSGDKPLGVAGSVAPAWRPGAAHRLAYAGPKGDLRVIDADSGRSLWRAFGGPASELLWSADGSRLLALRRTSCASTTRVAGWSGPGRCRRERGPRPLPSPRPGAPSPW